MADVLQLAREAGALEIGGTRHMTAFTQETLSAFRDAVLEEAAKRCEALRDEHCAVTGDPHADAYACSPDGTDCEFVGAWNDAAAAIRAMKGQP